MQTYTDKDIQAVLKKLFGFESFKGTQLKIIKSLLKGKDCFVIMPTGGGKSMCYQLPALMKEGTAIVISPLIALMKNQVDAMRNFGTDQGIAHFLNSSLNKNEIKIPRLWSGYFYIRLSDFKKVFNSRPSISLNSPSFILPNSMFIIRILFRLVTS